MIRLYSEGAGDVEVCKELKLPYKEFQKKEKDDLLFRELVEFGRLARKAWWLEQGRKAITRGAPAGAYNFWYAFMKNEFGWSDKTEVKDLTSVKQMSTDDIKSQLAILQSKIKKVPSQVELKELLDGTLSD